MKLESVQFYYVRRQFGEYRKKSPVLSLHYSRNLTALIGTIVRNHTVQLLLLKTPNDPLTFHISRRNNYTCQWYIDAWNDCVVSRGCHCRIAVWVWRRDADKSLARPTSRFRRTESIVSLERGVCSCAELQAVSCYRVCKEAYQATRAISTTWRRDLSSRNRNISVRVVIRPLTVLQRSLFGPAGGKEIIVFSKRPARDWGLLSLLFGAYWGLLREVKTAGA